MSAIESDDDDEDDDDDDETIEYARSFPASCLLISTDYHNLDVSYLNETKIITGMKNLISTTSSILGTIMSYHCIENAQPSKHIACYGILTNKNHIFVHGYIENETKAATAVDILSCDEHQLFLLKMCCHMLVLNLLDIVMIKTMN